MFDYDSYEEKHGKLKFVKYYIKGSFNFYFEEPRVDVLILNKELNAAYVEYHEMEEGTAAWFVRRDGRWIITKRKTH